MLSQAQREFIISIIDEAPDLTIATLRADGWPQANVVSFASDGLALYFGGNAKSQKAENIARDDRVSVALTCPYDDDWDAIRGLSIGGRARRVTDADELAKVGAAAQKDIDGTARALSELTGVKEEITRVTLVRAGSDLGLVATVSDDAVKHQQQLADDFHAWGVLPKKLTISDIVWRPKAS